MKETQLNKYVYDYKTVDVRDIMDIHKYLMKKNTDVK